MIKERLSDRVQVVPVSQPGSGYYLRPVGGYGQRQAGQRPPAVRQDGAGPALTVITALTGDMTPSRSRSASSSVTRGSTQSLRS